MTKEDIEVEALNLFDRITEEVDPEKVNKRLTQFILTLDQQVSCFKFTENLIKKLNKGMKITVPIMVE